MAKPCWYFSLARREEDTHSVDSSAQLNRWAIPAFFTPWNLVLTGFFLMRHTLAPRVLYNFTRVG